MDIKRKSELLKQAIESITRHDDAPIEEVEAAITEATTYASSEIQNAHARRAEAAKVQEKETITAGDVGELSVDE